MQIRPDEPNLLLIALIQKTIEFMSQALENKIIRHGTNFSNILLQMCIGNCVRENSLTLKEQVSLTVVLKLNLRFNQAGKSGAK